MNADQRHFLGRKIHSLTGMVPVGAFLVQHMYGNVLSLWGPKAYDEHVHFLLSLPMVVVLQWGMIYLPLAFHALWGVYYMVKSKQNVRHYPYGKNVLYTLQRLTGGITLIYVVYHMATTTFGFDTAEKMSMYATMADYFEAKPWRLAFYIVGVVAASFHFCNGIWGFCIMWGITITRKSQTMVWRGAMLLFVALATAGILSAVQLGTRSDKPMFEDPKAKLEREAREDREMKAAKDAEKAAQTE